MTTNFTTVLVSTFPWLTVTDWDCTLNFSYTLSPSPGEYSFTIREAANLTIHLTPATVTTNYAIYTGYATGNGSLNDETIDHTLEPPYDTETIIGSGPPVQNFHGAPVSQLLLGVNCDSDKYNFEIATAIVATHTQYGESATGANAVGVVQVAPRTLPLSLGRLSGSELLPAHGPSWTGGGDYYMPGVLGQIMTLIGVVTDSTAGNASVDWSFTPSPKKQNLH